MPRCANKLLGLSTPPKSGRTVLIHRDIWIAASDMMKVFGEDAAVRAAIRADAMAASGDEDSYAFWARTVRAIKELRGLGTVNVS